MKEKEVKLESKKETSLIGVSLTESEKLQKQGYRVIAIYRKDGVKVHDLEEVKK